VLLLTMTRSGLALPARPKLNLPAYQLPQKPEVVQAVYDFAADHPEVLRYVPCFCSCELMGHHSAQDCFVKSRAKNGDVLSWNEHGMTCAMCLAVAKRAMDMHNAHATVRSIRDEVERVYSHLTSNRTSTPTPP